MINNIALRLDLDALCNVAWLLSESYTLHKNNNNIVYMVYSHRDKSNHENGRMNEFQWRLWQRNPLTINHINLPFRKQKFHRYHA